jgi:endonuclease YncB( thermonuclease family)
MLALACIAPGCSRQAPPSDAQIRKQLVLESIASYPGACPCPDSIKGNGQRCAGSSAYARSGSIWCSPADISDADVAAFRAGTFIPPPNSTSRQAPRKPASIERVVSGRASVIDGDTLDIRGQRIRLTGIDAFEGTQTCTRNGRPYRCGQQAALWLADEIGRTNVRCEITATDRHQRALAVCRANGRDLNEAMVDAGHALAYRAYGSEYVNAEERARAAGRGAWAPGVVFQAPWDYRQRGR